MQEASVAVPSDSNSSPSPTPGSLSPLLPAGLVAAASALAWKLWQQRRQQQHKHQQHKLASTEIAPNVPLTASAEDWITSMGPLLLAAETAGGVDETELLSDEELHHLDLQLRMLMQDIDTQIVDLQDIAAGKMSAEAAEQFDAVSADIAAVEDKLASFPTGSEEATTLDRQLIDLQYAAFQALYPFFTDDSDRRTYRSLLYSRFVQKRLQEQVERQMEMRRSIKADLSNLSSGASSSSSIQESGLDLVEASGLLLSCAGSMCPHPRKEESGGEDAFFCTENTFGVADGVGGWAGEGIDPAEYPRALIAACEDAIHKEPNLKAVLQQAFVKTRVPGSCTAALAALDASAHLLHIVSVGDCGVRVYRQGKVIFTTEIQEWSFNQPYQLSHPDISVCNSPEDALDYEVQVQPGDVIVAGSDGLFDNIFDSEVISILQETLAAQDNRDSSALQGSAAELAINLMQTAKEHSRDPRYVSPFALEKQGKQQPNLLQPFLSKARGGKLDDITVIVGLVTERKK